MDTFEEKYKIIDHIGEGSFSDVLKCEEKESGQYYAAKRLKKMYKNESSVLTCAEIVAAHKIPYHTHILNMLEYHYDTFSGNVTFVFELMDMSMYEFLKTRKRGISERKTKEYLFQILKGLDHLHRNGLFHRDVKPENILMKYPSVRETPLCKSSRIEIIKLADLGSVRGIYSTPPYTEYISTRWYRSPECLLTVGHYGPKMDIWATGCVFYEMLTLLPLFPGNNEIDQLARIHQLIGTPSIQFLSKLKSKSRNCVFFPKLRSSGTDSLLPHCTRVCRNILHNMLEYDPDKRTNVRRLLRNSYFDDIREFFDMLEAQYKSQMASSHKRPFGDHISQTSRYYNKRYNTNAPDDARKSSKCSSTKSSKGSLNSAKSTTPSIEIPYYLPRQKSSSHSTKMSPIPLVDYKLTNCVRSGEKRPRQLSDPKIQSHKRNVELIFSHLQNTQCDKQVKRSNAFQSKSLVIPKEDHTSKRTNMRLRSKVK